MMFLFKVKWNTNELTERYLLIYESNPFVEYWKQCKNTKSFCLKFSVKRKGNNVLLHAFY